MIRSTKHHIKDLNKNKSDRYKDFLNEYDWYCKKVLTWIWNNGYKDFCIVENKLDIPKYIDYKEFDFNTRLSARARSSACIQVCQIIKSAVEKQRRRLWVKTNKDSNVKMVKFSEPKPTFVKPSLSSKCCEFEYTDGKFLGYVKLQSLGKEFGVIKIPIIRHPRSQGKMKAGFVFSMESIQVSWDREPIKSKTINKNVVAIDQGFKDIATLSDGQVTPKKCHHGHTLESIIEKITKKKKGSKGFKKSVDHRKNFVNYSINQLNFSKAKEVRLERIVNIGFGKRVCRKMSHWCNTEIRDKIKSKCEELEVPVIEQSCSYRSQRCSSCGLVKRSNRKGKEYKCKNCGVCLDSDYNASLNHLGDLPPFPFNLLKRKLNLGTGFFWFEQGFFFDAERRVPCCQN